jgi:hypothetical protein
MLPDAVFISLNTGTSPLEKVPLSGFNGKRWASLQRNEIKKRILNQLTALFDGRRFEHHANRYRALWPEDTETFASR